MAVIYDDQTVTAEYVIYEADVLPTLTGSLFFSHTGEEHE